MSESILDKVLYSQKQSALSNFDPEELSSKLFGILNDREQDIIIKRYGLSGKPRVTLEEIGSVYSVTRERIRQIENVSLKRIKESFSDDVLRDLHLLLRDTLDEHGDIMAEERLVETILAQDRYTDANTALMKFILNQLLAERLTLEKESENLYKSWSTPVASWEKFHAAVDHMVSVIETNGEPIALDTLLDRARDKVTAVLDKPSDQVDLILLNYLDVTKKIEENKFSEWGLSHWSSIRPRRMNDKIYLIMKKEGKPMHFVEIAKRINEAKFDDRIAYPATIHNELILDNKYVLVGRGIYALREWGYKPGVVLDVIRDIMKERGTPMTRDDIVQEVLKNRMVKRSTVILALMNKKHFSKDEHGGYRLSVG